MHVSCSIVCYKNNPSQVSRAFQSVVSSEVKRENYQITLILIDNSPDSKLLSVAKEFNALYIHLPENPGFGAAHNVALRLSLKSKALYHLVLNPDTHFSQNVISALLDYMNKYPEVGLVMPDIRYPDGRHQHLCKLLPNAADLIMRRFLPRLYESSGRLAQYELHASGYDKVMEVPSLSGCFMLLRTEVLRGIGIFDERFFMYMEDVDLCRRIGKVAKTVYFPHVSITHEYVKGSYKNRKLLFHHIRSAVLYFNKWGWIGDKERDEINHKTLQAIEQLNAGYRNTSTSA